MPEATGPIDAETVSENLMEPVFAVDAGDIAFVNERFLAVTQLSEAVALGSDCALFERFVEDGFSEFRAAVDAVARGDTDHERVELSMIHPKAAPVPRRLPAEVRVTPIVEDESFRDVLVVLRDISERKKHEQKLQSENERLEEFASVVSHDLRNPLNVAKGHLTLAREEFDGEHLASATDALDRMEAIVRDTLALAQQGQTVGTLERVALATVAEQCWQNVETADAALSVDDEMAISADPERLRNLFENLFRNAVEHGAGAVTVRVGSLETAGFYVEDDGFGISEGEREKVFEPGHSTVEAGTGFGLAIVRRIAEAHGWDAAVTESRGGGARFEITGVERVDP